MKESFFKPRGIFYKTNDFVKDRATLVFVHGLSGSSSAWFLFERHFAHAYNLVELDLRGHGKSRKPKGYRAYAFSEFADDLAALVEHLELRDFVLVSHSFGTLVALHYLRVNQSRVSAAIFLSPSFGVYHMPRARFTRSLIALGSRVLSVCPARTNPGVEVDYRKFLHTGDWNVRRITTDVLNTTPRVYLYCLERVYTFNRESWWSEISIPALIIHGGKDTVVPLANAAVLAAQVKNATLEVIPDANHILPLNNAPQVIRLIEEFLSR